MRKDATMPDLRARVYAEFREMPGLTLTVLQAARLFSLGLADCERILRELVQAGHLTTNGRTFASAGGGAHWAGTLGQDERSASLR
jgi:hypothetical protein